MHQRSTERADLFLRNYQHSNERIDSRLLHQSNQLAEENKHVLSQIVLAIEFLAKQGLSFRGHRDDKVDFSDDSSNRGNFIATLQLMSRNDQLLQKHLLSAKRNAKYTSKTIQNQITHIYASKIRDSLVQPLREQSLPYTVIADETTDHYLNQEILTLCLRYVDLKTPHKPQIQECLVSFIHLQRSTADTISSKIISALTEEPVCLDVKKICGQAYDGASVMSSSKAGVQARIKEICPTAMYSHCYSHCLNLSVASSCEVPEVRNMMGTVNEAHFFLSNSPKRQRMFDLCITKLFKSSSHAKLPGLCKTRWVERHTCFEIFLELYEPLITFLDAILFPSHYPELLSLSDGGSWNWDKDTAVKAQGLKAALTSFETIATFVITKTVLDEVKSLSVKLQKRDQDIYEALSMVSSITTRIHTIRQAIDTTFPSWYSEIMKLANDVGAAETVPRKTRIQQHRNNTPSTSPEEHYKRTIAIPLLDTLILQLNDRFTTENNKHLRSLLSLIPSVFLANNDQELKSKDFDYWINDLPFPHSLSGELARWKLMWVKHTVTGDNILPSNFLQSLGACDSQSLPNVHYLLVIGCTLPITSSEAERTFSLLRRLKTYTRSRLNEEHFSDLAVIAMHYAQRIPESDIIQAFIQQQPRRIYQRSVLED